MQWMLAAPPPVAADVEQATVCRDEGSWNHTVLPVPLDDTPIGTQLGDALICDRTGGDQAMARVPIDNAAKSST